MKGLFRGHIPTNHAVYNVKEIGSKLLGGRYCSKQGYLDFLRRQSRLHTPQDIDIIASNFKTLYDSETGISSTGIGSYIGDPTLEHDWMMFEAMKHAIKNGVNVIDTAANYRYYKSERTIGAAIRALVADSGLKREDVFVCTKIGYVTEDPERGLTIDDVIKECAQHSKVNSPETPITEDDFIGVSHSIHPGYLRYQLEQSLKNLGLKTVDVLYLHNPYEGQLAMKGQDEMDRQLRAAFEFLETAVSDGRVGAYGVASWNCFRSPPNETGIHASLVDLEKIAREVGGATHRLKFVQMPMNFIAHEPYSMPWQRSPKGGNLKTALTVCDELGLNVITSASFLQKAALNMQFPYQKIGLQTNAQAHLQLLRSMPEQAVKSCLVGMKTMSNVEDVCKMSRVPAMEPKKYKEFILSLSPSGGKL